MSTCDSLLNSLKANEKTVKEGNVAIQIRSCEDHISGQIDARSRESAKMSREYFRANKSSCHRALRMNEDKLFGPEHPEYYPDPVSMMRYQFGWRSEDKSQGVRVIQEHLKNDQGSFCVWRYQTDMASPDRPCLVFFHGGAFVAGDTATVENHCKLIAQRSGAIVLSTDYPLAPENPFPAGFYACFDTVRWAYAHADKLGISRKKIGVGGDSAGGNLALACTLRDRDEGTGMISYQALIYPLLAWSFAPHEPFYYWNEEQYFNPQKDPLILQKIREIGDTLQNCCSLYIPKNTDKYHPYISPITASCMGLPKTLLITAEYDFLRSQCDAYLKMLNSAGVDVRAIRYDGIFHGTFDRLGYAPQIEDMLQEISDDLQKL